MFEYLINLIQYLLIIAIIILYYICTSINYYRRNLDNIKIIYKENL